MEELETPPQDISPEPDRGAQAPAETGAPAAAGPEVSEAASTAEAEPEATEAQPAAVEATPEPPEASSEPEACGSEAAEKDGTPEPSETAPEAEAEVTPEETEVTAQVSVDELFASGDSAPVPAEVEEARLRAVLEAIVYVAEEPLTLIQLTAALGQPKERVSAIFAQLVAEFEKPEHGVAIREVAGGYKMATKPEHHEAVRSFAKSLKPPLKLSLPALETLAVIAYKQPVTGPEVMEVRGVQGAGVLKTLLDRKLIAVAGRKNVIGKPILYKTTREFLIQFGLKDLSELPSLKEFEEIRRLALSDNESPADSAAPENSSVPENAEPAPAAAAAEPAEAAAEAEPQPEPDASSKQVS